MFLLHKSVHEQNEDEYIAIFQAKIIITLRRGTYMVD